MRSCRRPGTHPELAPLLRTFASTTNSYKFLFFRAILKGMEKRRTVLAFGELFRLMLEEAWWPAVHYRLHLGARDLVAARLDDVIGAATEAGRGTEQLAAVLAAMKFDLGFERTAGLLQLRAAKADSQLVRGRA